MINSESGQTEANRKIVFNYNHIESFGAGDEVGFFIGTGNTGVGLINYGRVHLGSKAIDVNYITDDSGNRFSSNRLLIKRIF